MLILYTPPTQNHYFCLFKKAYIWFKIIKKKDEIDVECQDGLKTLFWSPN